ncbi:MAG: NAD(P)-dependent oxidoreductase [Spirochaetales bacterium]|nr:NAD(P)-dependent oxidoreductase [Spirochaetales bacterium]
MNIFLTGGTGFIGSYVTKILIDAGHSISLLARNPDKVPALKDLPGVTIIPGLLSDFDIINEHLRGKDACIHIALGWGEAATSMLKNDTFPSVYLFETAARAGISHFIYTSSTAAVANTPPQSGTYPAEAHPTDFYGAAKASSEKYLYAISHQSQMQCNIIRPGYTFGNPVVPGASMQPDDRLKYIARQAKAGNPINLTRHDGTQFLWAGDLAKIYKAVLDSHMNRQCYFGLGKNFDSWEKIAQKAIQLSGSKSTIILEEKGYDPVPYLFDVSLIKKDFNLEFEAWDRICEHLEYLIRGA